MPHAREAFDRIMMEEFDTVLDIGCGKGQHHTNFTNAGKQCTPTDWVGHFPGVVVGDFNKLNFMELFDVTWAAHVLEHQLNVHQFLDKMIALTKDNGWLVITVPPMKHDIVGGHVTLWNCGLLLYNLTMAGIDCRDIKLKQYGYNCTAIVQKKQFVVPWKQLTMGNGDIETLKNWMPDFAKQGFNGDIKEWNWT